MFKILFLRWWLFAALVFVLSVLAGCLGAYTDIYEKDSSKISFFIFGLCGFATVWCGIKTWRMNHLFEDGINSKEDSVMLNKLARQEEIGWFIAEQCLTWGMIGTVVGFIMMLSTGFISVNVADSASVQKMLVEIGYGMATALYTTLIGLICSVILKVQYFNLGLAIDTVKKEMEDKPSFELMINKSKCTPCATAVCTINSEPKECNEKK